MFQIKSLAAALADGNGKARKGVLHLPHAVIETPFFMPVATQGAVKAVSYTSLQNIVQTDIILSNTYHLYLRIADSLLKKAGGLHAFCGWKKAILTDSGGYQVYSLSKNCKIKEEGATFQSHIDGAKHFLSPEKAVDIQRTIGADIMMAFDECLHHPATFAETRKSMDLTHRWLIRGINQFKQTEPLYQHEQYLFPIVQGGMHETLRKESATFVVDATKDAFSNKQNVVGYGIGGLSVGEDQKEMLDMLSIVNEVLPVDSARYLMGVGMPTDLLFAISCGVDMFDCVLPTRNARNGMLFTTKGIINIRNEKWKNDTTAIDNGFINEVSNHTSKAFLRHLFMANEILGLQLASVHNLSFYIYLMQEARSQIEGGNFLKWMAPLVDATAEQYLHRRL